jgi:hypothetical protein
MPRVKGNCPGVSELAKLTDSPADATSFEKRTNPENGHNQAKEQ